MIEIDKIANNLVLGENGIWISRNQSIVSYPEAGNAVCYAVEDGSFWFKHRSQCIIEIMRTHPPEGAVFDIGGGNGFVASALIEAGIETVLVEPGKTGVVNAKTRGVSNIIQSTLQDAGFREGTLPAAGLFDVLEHIEDDASFLKTLSGLLIQGGRLYLTVPAYQVLWSVVDEHAGHYRRYTIKSLSKVLSLAGFNVEFASYFFVLMVVPILLFRSIPSLMGLRRRKDIESYSGELVQSSMLINRLLSRLLSSELSALRKRPLSWGASCIVVARATQKEL